MLRLVAGTVLLLLIGFTEALAVEEIKKDNIGPWEIEATFKNNKFDHCAISRKVDEVVASFLRTSDGLSLTLNIELHKRTYPRFWEWREDMVSVAMQERRYREFTRFGRYVSPPARISARSTIFQCNRATARCCAMPPGSCVRPGSCR